VRRDLREREQAQARERREPQLHERSSGDRERTLDVITDGIAHARDASLTSSQWRIQKFSKGGRKNLLAPTLIYRKCTQRSICLYTEKGGFLR